MGIHDFEILIDKSLQGECTPAEQRMVDEWYDSFDRMPGFTEQFSEIELGQIRERQLGKMRKSWSEGDSRIFLVIV